MLRVLIIDDEAPARRYLRRLLESNSGVQVEGEAGSLEQARSLMQHHNPDAVFLDIELSSGTGFDLLDGLNGMESLPAVVFVTAHNNYATRAFDVEAVDYLLKPVSPERLQQALGRLRPRASNYLSIRARTGTRMVKIQDLTLAQAQGDYVRLCSAAHADELMHITMKRLAPQLPTPPFFAVSRSLILNLDHVSHVVHRPGAQTEVAFNNSVMPILLGSTASARLRRQMG
ncbi:LytR/AlgR family response regulator transcription factor [Bordetella petrii]|uniref:LytR/AlgR family response regulator transcription factor n=1 Tax=Bordetella petrii TaxID=94624 RepID=UPI001E2D9DC1|nr:LytTR family DNA-binding domain-containing protein [Bordetella petrii]MCD0504962.1 LytTR family DNA-binding domain-containing protein [Bordetella petrii]